MLVEKVTRISSSSTPPPPPPEKPSFPRVLAGFLFACLGLTLTTPAAAQKPEITHITATPEGENSVTVENQTPSADIPSSNPIRISAVTSQPKGTMVTVTFKFTTRNVTNLEFYGLNTGVEGTGNSGLTVVPANRRNESEASFTHDIEVGADPPLYTYVELAQRGERLGYRVRFTYALEHSSASIDNLQAVSGSTSTNNVAGDGTFTVGTTGTNAPVTLTITPTSTEGDATFTATASINGQSTAFASQGSGDNLRLVLNRDFPIGDTEVVIALNDGQGNEDTRTITISVTDNGGPVFTKVSGELNGVTREVTSFAKPPLLSLGTKKEDGTEKVTFTVEGRDNSGAAPTLHSVTVGGNAVTGNDLRADEFEFDVDLTVNNDPVDAVIVLRDGANNETTATVRLQVRTIRSEVILIVESSSPGSLTLSAPNATPPLPDKTVTLVAEGEAFSLREEIAFDPGAFALSYTLSEGLALVGFTCTGAQVDLAARTITGSLVEDQKLECRLSGQSVAQAVAETVAQIDTFMDARAQAIVANQPARGRRTARLGGGGGLGGIGGAGGTLNFNGQTMPLTGVPVSVEISPTRTHMSGSLLEARRSGTLGLDAGEGMESLGRLALLGLRLAGVDDFLGPRSRREVRSNGRGVQVAEKFDFAYDAPMNWHTRSPSHLPSQSRSSTKSALSVYGSDSMSMDQMVDVAGLVMNAVAGSTPAHDETPVNTTSDGVSPTVATPIAHVFNGLSGVPPTGPQYRQLASPPGAQNQTGASPGETPVLAAAHTHDNAAVSDMLWDAWFDISFGRYEVDSNQGVFGVFHVGVDRRIGQDLLLGVSAQVDHADGRSGPQEDGIEGTGWMVGPYMTARIYQNFYIDAAGSYGRADNSIALGGGLRADSFGSQRWFARAALFGDFAVSGWGEGRYGFQPSVDVSRYVETSDAYRDSRGLTIRSSKIELSDVSFGGRLTRNSASGLYSQYVSVDGIWTFEARGSGRNGSGRSNLEGGSSTGMRGRLGAGMDFADLLGGSFGMDVSYDGLGRTHYETLTITLGYGRRF